jgi:hypothetical protein
MFLYFFRKITNNRNYYIIKMIQFKVSMQFELIRGTCDEVWQMSSPTAGIDVPVVAPTYRSA